MKDLCKSLQLNTHFTLVYMELITTRDLLVSMKHQVLINSLTELETELPHSESLLKLCMIMEEGT